MGLAAGQHELLQKQTNSFEIETYAVSRQQDRMESSAGWAVQRTSAFRRDEPAAADGQLCTGTGTTARRWRGGRQRGLGSRLPDHWNRFDPELRTSIASNPPRCQPVPVGCLPGLPAHTCTHLTCLSRPVDAALAVPRHLPGRCWSQASASSVSPSGFR